MTFEEFENTLQDWLDEGRLDEADQLLAQVTPGDRDQCVELLETYRLLFSGLAALEMGALEMGAPEPTTLPQNDSPATAGWKSTSLAGIGLALALSLSIVALAPGMFLPQKPTITPAAESFTTNTPGVVLPPDSELPLPASYNIFSQRDLTRLATSSLEPLARSMATKTDFAFRSINQVTDFTSTDFNPIDQQLSAYPEAGPLIETLSRGLMPGTHSLTDAFSVLQESAGSASAVPADPATTPAASEVPDNASVS